jgi:hypothetical protein
VPQIWLTYDELAALMNCGREEARGAAAAFQLDRRKSRDGQIRAKLTPSLTKAFLDGLLRLRLEQELATCTSDLWAMHQSMAANPAAKPQVRSAIAG